MISPRDSRASQRYFQGCFAVFLGGCRAAPSSVPSGVFRKHPSLPQVNCGSSPHEARLRLAVFSGGFREAPSSPQVNCGDFTPTRLASGSRRLN